MSRFFFFVQEAFRALRRNAAPTTAASPALARAMRSRRDTAAGLGR